MTTQVRPQTRVRGEKPQLQPTQPQLPVERILWHEMPSAIDVYEFSHGQKLVCLGGNKALEYRLIRECPSTSDNDVEGNETTLLLEPKLLNASEKLLTQAHTIKACPVPFSAVQMALGLDHCICIDFLASAKTRITIDWAAKEHCEWSSSGLLMCLAKDSQQQTLMQHDLRTPVSLATATTINKFKALDVVKDISASHLDPNYVAVLTVPLRQSVNPTKLLLIDVRKAGDVLQGAEVQMESFDQKITSCLKFRSSATLSSYLYNNPNYTSPQQDKLAIGIDKESIQFRSLKNGMLSLGSDERNGGSLDCARMQPRRLRWRPIFDDYLSVSYSSATHVDIWQSEFTTSPVVALKHHTNDVRDMCWVDHRRMITIGKDNWVKITDMGTPQETFCYGKYIGRNVVGDLVVDGSPVLGFSRRDLVSSVLNEPTLTDKYVSGSSNSSKQCTPVVSTKALTGIAQVPSTAKPIADPLPPEPTTSQTPNLMAQQPTGATAAEAPDTQKKEPQKRSVLQMIRRMTSSKSEATPPPASNQPTPPPSASTTRSIVVAPTSIAPQKPPSVPMVTVIDVLVEPLRSLNRVFAPTTMVAVGVTQQPRRTHCLSRLYSICTNESIAILLRRSNSSEKNKPNVATTTSDGNAHHAANPSVVDHPSAAASIQQVVIHQNSNLQQSLSCPSMGARHVTHQADDSIGVGPIIYADKEQATVQAASVNPIASSISSSNRAPTSRAATTAGVLSSNGSQVNNDINYLSKLVAPSNALALASTLLSHIAWDQVEISSAAAKAAGTSTYYPTTTAIWFGVLNLSRAAAKLESIFIALASHILRSLSAMSEAGDYISCTVLYFSALLIDKLARESAGKLAQNPLSCLDEPGWRYRALEWIDATATEFRELNQFVDDRELMAIGLALLPEVAVFNKFLQEYLVNNRLVCGYCQRQLSTDEDTIGTNSQAKSHLRCNCRSATKFPTPALTVTTSNVSKTAAHVCAICSEVVEGTFQWFPSCGHGAHPEHLASWIDRSRGSITRCPSCAEIILASTVSRSTVISYY